MWATPPPVGYPESQSSSSRPAGRRGRRFGRSSQCTSSCTPSTLSPAARRTYCSEGHVCDVTNDLLNASLSGNELETHVLDAGRDDYYGHSGTWTDVQDSLFLERLDSPDRAAPSLPASLTATDGAAPGAVRLSWRASTDDVGPIAYRVYQDDRFISTTTSTSAVLGIAAGDTSSYSIRASDSVGHLSQPLTIRFRLGLGIVDGQGKLVRDTVRPPAVGRVSVRRAAKTRPSLLDAGARRRWPARLPGHDRIAGSHGDEAGRDADPGDAAHRRLSGGGRPGRQHRPEDDGPAPPAPITGWAPSPKRPCPGSDPVVSETAGEPLCRATERRGHPPQRDVSGVRPRRVPGGHVGPGPDASRNDMSGPGPDGSEAAMTLRLR